MNEMARPHLDSRLSKGHLPRYPLHWRAWFGLPIYPDLLRILFASCGDTRSLARRLDGSLADSALQSLGGARA